MIISNKYGISELSQESLKDLRLRFKENLEISEK